MKKILIISFSQISSDPRVMRQIKLLESIYDVTVLGFGEKPKAVVNYINIKAISKRKKRAWWALILFFGFFENYYWNREEVISAKEKIKDKEFDLIVANDITALPLAFCTARETPILFDAHEYSPKEFEDQFVWRILFGRYYKYLCLNYLHKTSGITTVCQGIANEYAKNFYVIPQVVHNVPRDQRLKPCPVLNSQIRLIHHGAAIRSRHLETMIDVMSFLEDRFTLDFMLIESDKVYLSELKRLAYKNKRIKFIPAVPMDEICTTLNSYDMGIYLLPPINFNHKHALPNKFFEFIQARLAVAIGPSPEMASILRTFGFGIVTDSFDPQIFAKAINAISFEDLKKYKDAAHQAAMKINYDTEGKILLNLIKEIIH